MAQILVRQLADDVKERLRARAVRNDRSLEAEARSILEDVANAEPSLPKLDKNPGFGSRMAELFKDRGFTEEEKKELDRNSARMRHRSRIRRHEFAE